MNRTLEYEGRVRDQLRPLIALADLGPGPLADHIGPDDLHQALNTYNRIRLAPRTPGPDWEDDLQALAAAELVQCRFVEEARAETRDQVADVPLDPDGFLAWFVGLEQSGPGQYDPFFDHLATAASREQIRYFIQQEYCGEIGFDDLIALTQVRLPEEAKQELARNFWDEQGQGDPDDIHDRLYVAMVDELGAGELPESELLWETLAVANLLTALACSRSYAWHSLGALSVIELTSPSRAPRIAAGLQRVGLSASGHRYFLLHSSLDVEHWRAWLAHVVEPLVAGDPSLTVPLAEGALLRLNAGQRLIARYRQVFDLAC